MYRLLEIALANAVLATALALVAVVVGRIVRRPAVSHCLWLLVLLRLVAPPVMGVAVPFWSGLAPSRAVTPGAEANATSVAAETRSGAPEPQRTTATTVADAAPAATSVPLDRESHANLELADATPGVRVPEPVTGTAAPLETDTAAARQTQTRSQRLARIRTMLSTAAQSARRGTVLPWLSAIWITGSVVWFVAAGVRILRFHRLLEHSKPASDALQDEADTIAECLGVTRRPQVLVAPFTISPLVWGLGSTVWVVLPAKLVARLNADERASLLAHELAHLRRRDHLVRWLELLVIGLYWWHPVAWLARRELSRAEEQCCDAWVVWSLPDTALAYAKALLKTVDFLSEAKPSLPPAASGAGHIHSLKRRVSMILHMPPGHMLSWPARSAALLLALLVLPFGLQPALRANAASTVATPEDAEPAEAPEVAAISEELEAINVELDDDEDDAGEVDKRLDALEKKLDKLISELGKKDAPGSRKAKAEKKAKKAAEKKAKARKAKPKAEKKPDDKAEAKAEREQDEAEARAEALEQEAEARAEALERKAEALGEQAEALGEKLEATVEKLVDEEKFEALARNIEKAVEVNIDPERFEQMGERIAKAVQKGLDTEQLEKLGEEIGKAVEKGIDSKSFETMGKEIEAAVKNSIDPERLEAMGKEIEAAVKETIDTEKLQAMGKEIEAAVKGSIDTESLKKLGEEIGHVTKERVEVEMQAEKEAKKEVLKKQHAAKKLEAEAKRGEQMQKRMDALEKQLDRLMKQLNDDDDDDADEDEDETEDDVEIDVTVES